MKSPALLLLACFVVSGCNPEGQTTPSAAATEVAHAPAAPKLPAEPSTAVPAVVVPGWIAACNPVVEATIKWSFDHLSPAPHLIDVYVGDGALGAEPKLFVTGPSRSEAKTGSWVRPGVFFLLRNHDNGEELSRVTVQGPGC